MRTPARPPLDGLKKSWIAAAPKRTSRATAFCARPSFCRAPMPGSKAQEWFERFPKQAYWTEIESWFERPDDVIEFTMRRLPSAD